MIIGVDSWFLFKIEQGTASYSSQLLKVLKPVEFNKKLVLLNIRCIIRMGKS